MSKKRSGKGKGRGAGNGTATKQGNTLTTNENAQTTDVQQSTSTQQSSTTQQTVTSSEIGESSTQSTPVPQNNPTASASAPSKKSKTKKKMRNPNGSRNHGAHISTAHLELPEGYRRPSKNKKKRNKTKRLENPVREEPGPFKEAINPHLRLVLYQDTGAWHKRIGYTKAQYEQFLAKKHDFVPLLAAASDKLGDPTPQAVPKPPWYTEMYLIKAKWPEVGKCLTSAPFLLNKDGPMLAASPKQRASLITKVPEEITDKILGMLTHQDLKQFALTCAGAHQRVAGFWSRWDLTSGDMNHCDLSEDKLRSAISKGTIDPGAEEFRRGASYLLVSPVRKTIGGSQHQSSQISLRTELRNSLRLLQGINNFGLTVEKLHLHRVPFLDPAMIRLLLCNQEDLLPKLRELGVYACPMIHFGDTVQLLQAFETRVEENGHRRIKSFDFYPRFHQGGMHMNRPGSYGITWANSGHNTDKAVFSALLFRILPLAKKLGFDFISPSSSFRQWLEKLPLADRSVPRALDLFIRYGVPSLPLHGELPVKSKAWLRQVFAIVTADEPAHERTFEHQQRRARCAVCETVYPRFFMLSEEMCYGCSMAYYLDKEADHGKADKAFVLAVLLGRITEHHAVKKLAELVEEDDGMHARFRRQQSLALNIALWIDKVKIGYPMLDPPQGFVAYGVSFPELGMSPQFRFSAQKYYEDARSGPETRAVSRKPNDAVASWDKKRFNAYRQYGWDLRLVTGASYAPIQPVYGPKDNETAATWKGKIENYQGAEILQKAKLKGAEGAKVVNGVPVDAIELWADTRRLKLIEEWSDHFW